MSSIDDFRRHFGECPLVAIIRGVQPAEAEDVGRALYDAGIRIIEVPLNSPQPFESISRLASSLGGQALIGAGTVLDASQVPQVKAAGGRLIVSPNTDARVIEATVAARMVSSPGYFTPSEAFTAIRAGAHALKLFPAEGATPALIKAHKAVLPQTLPIIVVGGVKPDGMRPWIEAGAEGFGLGSGLFKPGVSAAEIAANARGYVAGLER